MNVRSVLPAALLFFLISPQAVCGFTLYLKEFVIAAENKLTVDDITLPGPGSEHPGAEASGQELPYSPPDISLIPAAQVKALVAGNYPGSLAVIGQRTAVIPEKLIFTCCQSFLFQFIRFAESLQKSREHRIDIRFLQPVSITGECTGNTFRFALPCPETDRGEPVTGNREIVCTDSAGRQRLLKVFIKQSAVFPESPGQGDNRTAMEGNGTSTAEDLFDGYRKTVWKTKEVKAGDTVVLHFYKGNIHLKMDGLAFTSGSLGDTVSVKPSTTQKRFKGIVTGEKEVQIEIP